MSKPKREIGKPSPALAQRSSFNFENFKKFCAALRVDTKDKGQISFKFDSWKGTQKYAIAEIANGLSDGVHRFVILKGRQQGISTVMLALDLYWIFRNGGLSGSLVTHNEETRDEFRVTLEMFIESLPQEFKTPVNIHNRTQLVCANRSRFAYQVAGTRKNSRLGKGKGLTFLHGTEVAEWGDEEGFASLQAAMSESNPKRLEVYESTAQGFNFFEELWSSSQESVSTRCIFIGWWRNEEYRKERGSREFDVYWDDKLQPDERTWVKEIKDLYDFDVEPEQIAWWRWTLAEKMNGDMDVMYQNHPPTAEYAFIASGSNFFSTARLSDETKRVKKEPKHDMFRFVLRDNFEDCDITETIAKHCNLRIFQYPVKGAYYVIGADPAYGSSDWADRFCASVWRCYADGMEQVAEFNTEQCSQYQFAWVILYLAGAYQNCMLNLEINGPGQAVFQEMQQLKRAVNSKGTSPVAQKILGVVTNLQHYLYRRLDSFSRPSNYHWVTTTQTKERMMNLYKDCFERGISTVQSEYLLDEMRSVIRESGSLGAPGRGKDDRVIAAALAHVAWSDYTRNKCIQEGMLRPKIGADDAVDGQQQQMSQQIKGYLKRLGVRV